MSPLADDVAMADAARTALIPCMVFYPIGHVNKILETLATMQSKAYKQPLFCRVPLDMGKVFAEVQARGGYQRVTDDRGWKEVCRTLGHDLTGQTSASTSMRQTYERTLMMLETALKGESPATTGRLIQLLKQYNTESCQHVVERLENISTIPLDPPQDTGKGAIGLCLRVPSVEVDGMLGLAVTHAKESEEGMPAALQDPSATSVWISPPKSRSAMDLEACVVIAYDATRFDGRGGHQVCFRLGLPTEFCAWTNLKDLMSCKEVALWQNWTTNNVNPAKAAKR